MEAVDFARRLAERAHANALAIGQKNSAELLPRRAEAGFDFAVVEQCGEYDACGLFTAAYGDQVYAIEYTQSNFDKDCEQFPQISIVLRD
ncbi:MAG: endo alpha-1,4 polygalactosaminidase, partial [Propionivibrio sp.]